MRLLTRVTAHRQAPIMLDAAPQIVHLAAPRIVQPAANLIMNDGAPAIMHPARPHVVHHADEEVMHPARPQVVNEGAARIMPRLDALVAHDRPMRGPAVMAPFAPMRIEPAVAQLRNVTLLDPQ